MKISKQIQDLMLSSDKPITHPKNDKLDYAQFSENLAKSITNMAPNDGIVLSLNGPWGSGKTTVIHFVIHYLKQFNTNGSIKVLEFNPWWFSGKEDLTRMLIGQISSVLGMKDYKIIKNLLADFTDLIADTNVIPGIGGLKGAGKKLRSEKNIAALKKNIEDLLTKKNQKILITVDDIDRLTPDEICQLFRAIKAVGNFPNIIYLLVFDESIVLRALDDEFGSKSGRNFLEKIIQVPFSLPLPDKYLLQELLFNRLDVILADSPPDLFDGTYWQNIYFGGITYFINTPRDVTRLTNSLQTTFPALSGEVNPVDFIAIETCRVFCGDVFNQIRKNKDKLIGLPRFEYPQQRNEFEASFDTWFGNLSNDDEIGARGILKRMFPKFAHAYGGTGYSGEFNDKWNRKLRICTDNHFDKYFKYCISIDEISSSEMQEIIESTNDKEIFSNILLELSKKIRRNGTTKVRLALRKIEEHLDDIPVVNIPTVIEVLFDIGDELILKSDSERGLFDYGNDIQIARILYQSLMKLDDSKRYKLIKTAVETGNAVSTVIMEFSQWGFQHGKYGEDEKKPESEWVVNKDRLTELESIALSKIRDHAEEGKLHKKPLLKSILHYWGIWSGDSAEVKQWVTQYILDDADLLIFVSLFGTYQKSQTIGDYAIKRIYRLDPEWLSDYVDTDIIYARLTSIALDDYPDELQVAAKQFILEYKMRKAGMDPNNRHEWR